MTEQKRPIGIDLFCGAGGMSLGFEQAGFDILAAVDVDPIHCATHEFNFPNCASICASVADLSGATIKKIANIGKRDIDVVFGGAPCQGFSMIGKRALDDSRNQLVFHFVRLVKELRPKFFVFENVKGLTIGNHRQLLSEMIDDLEKAGYRVERDYRVLNAAEFGVPQDRQRLFLMGARKGIPLPKYPSPTFNYWRKGKGRNVSDKTLPRTPTVWEAIGDIPDADKYVTLFDTDEVKAKLAKPSKYAANLRGDIEDPLDFSYRRAFDPALLTASMRTLHTEESIRRFSDTTPGTTEPISRFLRLDPNGVSNTLRAGTDSQRGAHTSPRPIHPKYPRVITVREASRLHSYPDWFRMHRTKWHGFRQVGNSVPPLLARAVASTLVTALKYKPSRPMGVLPPSDIRLIGYNMSAAAEHYGVASNVIPQRIRKPEQKRRRRPVEAEM